MITEAAPDPVSQGDGLITLPRATFDLMNFRRQMILGLIAILLLCFVTYWQCIPTPLSGEDAGQVRQVLQAWHGDWHWVANGVNQRIEPEVFGYRPLFFMALFLECRAFGMHPDGYRVVNILLLFSACAFISLIVFEFTGRFGNRLGACPAIWAGLLYAVYPLHSGFIIGVNGTQLLLCSLFELAAILCLMRFQLLRERPYYLWSLACSILALLSSEAAWTIPYVITAWLLLSPNSGPTLPGSIKESAIANVRLLAPFWAILIVYCLCRPVWTISIVNEVGLLNVFIGPLVPSTSISHLFTGVGSWFPSNVLIKPDLGVGCFLLVLRLITLQASFRLVAFIAIWLNTQGFALLGPLSVQLLPTAPICAGIALAALPAIDCSNKKVTVALTVVGTVALLVLLICWALATS